MEPVLFDGCFGWLHPATGAAPAPMGVVLCRPLGNEDICTHREWMDLADMLARAGLPTLRFDYRASGDSADLPDDETRPGPAIWLDNIRSAIACLQQETGVGSVALCGLRLGGALAWLAAQELGGIAALALLAPAISGRTYVRELRAQASGSSLAVLDPPPAAGSATPLNSNGFLWPSALLRQIEGIDLAAPGPVPAPKVLLMLPRPSRQASALIEKLRAAGTAHDRQSFPGYDALMFAPLSKATPEAAFGALTAWLAEAALTAGSLPALPPPFQSDALRLDHATETPFRFGRDQRLFGILNEPDQRGVADDFIVLSVHTGTNHHVGNGRLTVQMARSLAAAGIPSLRMDVAGIGDSPIWPGDSVNPLYGPQGPMDVSAALDALQARGYHRVMVFGLCAGAYLAFHAAVLDPRIVAVVAVNLQQFFWVEGTPLELAVRRNKRTLRSYVKSMSNRGEWRRLIGGDADVTGILRVLVRRGVTRLWHRVRDLLPPAPHSPPGKVRNWMRLLSERGTRLWLVHSPDDPGLLRMEMYLGRQSRHVRDLPGISALLLHNSEHNLNSIAARAAFLRLFQGWAIEAGNVRPARSEPTRRDAA